MHSQKKDYCLEIVKVTRDGFDFCEDEISWFVNLLKSTAHFWWFYCLSGLPIHGLTNTICKVTERLRKDLEDLRDLGRMRYTWGRIWKNWESDGDFLGVWGWGRIRTIWVTEEGFRSTERLSGDLEDPGEWERYWKNWETEGVFRIAERLRGGCGSTGESEGDLKEVRDWGVSEELREWERYQMNWDTEREFGSAERVRGWEIRAIERLRENLEELGYWERTLKKNSKEIIPERGEQIKAKKKTYSRHNLWRSSTSISTYCKWNNSKEIFISKSSNRSIPKKQYCVLC